MPGDGSRVVEAPLQATRDRPRQQSLPWAARYAAEKRAVLRMEFTAFLHAFMLIPVQVVRTSRRLVFRLLAWNPWQAVFLRGCGPLRVPLRR